MAGVVETNTTEYDPSSRLPLKLQGKVVHGFGRGSRQLGFPTGKLKLKRPIRGADASRVSLISFVTDAFLLQQTLTQIVSRIYLLKPTKEFILASLKLIMNQ